MTGTKKLLGKKHGRKVRMAKTDAVRKGELTYILEPHLELDRFYYPRGFASRKVCVEAIRARGAGAI